MREPEERLPAEPPLGGIFGTGRSGSTWVGAIANSHPDLVYRFEPFHRLREDPVAAELRARLESPACGPADLEAAYAWLRRPHPALEKPPMFRKRCMRNLGRRRLWPVARVAAPARWLFERLYAPTGRPLLVFKEVTMEPLMERLLERTRVPVVYLVRHPCGVVGSMVRGQERGLMSSGRLRVLESLLEKHDPELALRYGPRLAAASPLTRNALLWRIDVERGVRAAAGHPRGLLLVYEEVCREPRTAAERLLGHFGLDLAPETEAFLEASSASDRGARRRAGEGWVDDYFSVYRDPRRSMDAWKQQLGREAVEEILDVVRDSPAFAACAGRGGWAD